VTAPLELCFMTVRQASLAELVDAAGRHGFRRITLSPRAFVKSGLTAAELRLRLDDAGVTVGYIDGLSSPLPGTPGGIGEDDCFALADSVGAPAINVVHYGGPPVPFAEMADVVGGLAERAHGRGLAILLEFLPDTGIPDLPVALDLVRAAGPDRAGVMLDTWHLARAGGGPAQLSGDAAALIGGLQVSDRTAAQDARPYVPMSGRYLPGAGELPLVEIVAPVLAARPELAVGIEVLNDELRAMTVDDAAAVAADALRALMALVQPSP
jgi:sugar phosphate isomerase/epimerase